MLSGNMNKYCIDIDGTICTQEQDYSDAKPFLEIINFFNELYDNGNIIIYFTARGSETGINWEPITIEQFKEWGVKYHQLLFNKPSADYYIDDKNLNVKEIQYLCL